MERDDVTARSPDPDIERLRAEVADLARENRLLRSELQAHALAPRPHAPPAATPHVSARRRWTGRLVRAALVVTGLGIGAWYAHSAGLVSVRDRGDGPGAATPVVAPPRPPAPPAPPQPRVP